MDIKSLKLTYFSPTGTSKKVVSGIARGLGEMASELIDITKPEERKKTLKTTKDDLLIIAVPVYMGRVPALLNEWLNSIEADNTPAVCVVVYGNREYDNALIELRDILCERNCKPFAGAAFIGEHSFSGSEVPTAEGRPDENDMKMAEDFGIKIKSKLSEMLSNETIRELEVRGEFPYGGVTELWDVDFIEVSDECVQCGICAEVCPMDAVDYNYSSKIDIKKCITCCACIKKCPQKARYMKDSPVKEAQLRLYNLYNERKEPVYFI